MNAHPRCVSTKFRHFAVVLIVITALEIASTNNSIYTIQKKLLLGIEREYYVSLYGNKNYLMNKFEVLFLTEARAFLLLLDAKSRDKIIFNIDKAKVKSDNDLLKKLQGEIWELRTLFNKTHYRIFAFWDKEDKQNTLVLTTHGIIKKTGKTPEKEIEKAEKIRLNYFELKFRKKNGNKK